MSPSRIAHGFHRLDPAAAREHRQPAEEDPLRLREVVVAPLDGAAQGSLPIGNALAPGRQDLQAMLEAGEQSGRRQHLGPGGGQLDGQRQTVEARDDRGDRAELVLGRLETGPGDPGTIHEQRDGPALAQRLGGSGVGQVRNVERRDGILLLSVEPEGAPAGDQHLDPRGGLQQPVHERCRVEDLLEVVEHEEHGPVAQVLGEGLGRGPVAGLDETERAGHDRGDQARLAHLIESHEERPVDERRPQLLGRSDREAGLARPTRAGQRHEPVLAHERDELLDLTLAPDQACQRLGQVAAPRVEGADRREVGREPIDHELVEPFLAIEVLEPVVAEVAHIHSGGQGATRERLRLRRQQHLAAVRRRGDAGRPMDVEPDVVVAAPAALAGVDPDPDLDDRAVRPIGSCQRLLDGDRGPDRAGRRREDHEERVALGADLDAILVRDRRPDQLGLPLEQRRVPVAEALEQARRPLDVAEQEGDGAGRQLGASGAGLGAGHAPAATGGVIGSSPSPSLVIGSDEAFSRRARRMSGRDRAEIAAATRYEAP